MLGAGDADEPGHAQLAQGAAALHPVGGIHEAEFLPAIRLQAEDAGREAGLAQQALEALLLREGGVEEPLAPGQPGGLAVQTLLRQVAPAAAQGTAAGGFDDGRILVPLVLTLGIVQAGGVADRDRLDHAHHGEAGEGRRQPGRHHGHGEPHEVVGRVADGGLVEVADLHAHPALDIGEGADIAQVAIAADPDRRSLREDTRGSLREPVVEARRRSAHVREGRSRYLAKAAGPKQLGLPAVVRLHMDVHRSRGSQTRKPLPHRRSATSEDAAGHESVMKPSSRPGSSVRH